MYAIIANNEEIFVGIVSFVADVEYRARIRRTDMYSWPDMDFTHSWNPTRILTNDAHRNIIFI